MRHETCPVCTTPAFQREDAEIVEVVTLAEQTGLAFHHHHVMRCSSCGQQWYDDVVMLTAPHGAVRVLTVERRGTGPCDCPEDDEPRYQARAVIVKVADGDCACSATDLDQEHVVVTQ